MFTGVKMNSDSHKGDEFISRSTLYQEFLAERDEILRHKWLESEKAGRDIGFERALLDWILNYREGWRNSRRSQGSRQQHQECHN